MARKSASGRHIISAAEVGSFVVCQEAWRLKELAKVSSNKSWRAHEGNQLHRRWAEEYDEASYLSKAARIILFLILIALFFQLSFGKQ